jgi:hypothetical protein
MSTGGRLALCPACFFYRQTLAKREAVRILRKDGFKAPIILLTGYDTDSDTNVAF